VGIQLWRLRVLAEHGGVPPYSYDPGAGMYSQAVFAWSAAYSPNLDLLPYQVEFPLDLQGDLVDSVLVHWQDDDPAELAEQLLHSFLA